MDVRKGRPAAFTMLGAAKQSDETSSPRVKNISVDICRPPLGSAPANQFVLALVISPRRVTIELISVTYNRGTCLRLLD